MTEKDDGSVVCEAGDGTGTDTLFRMDDVNGYYQRSADSEPPIKLTLSEVCVCFMPSLLH